VPQVLAPISVPPSTNVTTNVATPTNLSAISSVSVSSTDQVLLLLTDSFSKMANALTEKQSIPRLSGQSSQRTVKNFGHGIWLS
jgi:hypothetical protein